MKLFNTKIYLTSFFFILSFNENAQSELITGLTAELTTTNGINNFVYSVSNDQASTLNILALTISVDNGVDILQITGPDGWDQSLENGSLVSWEATDSPFAIRPGESAQFTILSRNGGFPHPYTIFGFSDSPPFFDTNHGSVISPSVNSIPEPSSMILLGTGLVALGGYTWHCRRFAR